jgi:hypothetical protein
MTWAKFDDRFPSHLKVLRLSDAAFRLFVTSVCFSCEQLTDGEIEDGIPQALPRSPSGDALDAAIGELVRAGLWERLECGWMIHDFHEWNPDADSVLAKRAAAKERMKSARSQRVRANRSRTTRERSQEQNEKFARSSPNPVPVPVPVPLPSGEDPPTPLPERPRRPDPCADAMRGKGPGTRADVQQVFERFKTALGLSGLKFLRGAFDLQAVTLAETIDAAGLDDCLLVADECKHDRMVTGQADDKGMDHKSVAYVFGNPTTFARVLASAQKKQERITPRRSTVDFQREVMDAEADLSDYRPPVKREAS